jgi:NTP pyrophosphatase (non-canonical NTP hydrolase)
MNLNEYQEAALKTAVYPRDPVGILYPFLGLASEAGEVCGKMSKILRGDFKGSTEAQRSAHTKLIVSELGDVLWMLSACAREVGVSLEDVAQANIAKLAERANRGVLKGSGDNR